MSERSPKGYTNNRRAQLQLIPLYAEELLAFCDELTTAAGGLVINLTDERLDDGDLDKEVVRHWRDKLKGLL